jgi:TP53 regulating kinase and related kinases
LPQRCQRKLIKRGAEADIFVISWFGEKAISKIRKPKPYRNALLDGDIRKKRTIHEANMLSATKLARVTTPFIYFVDPKNAEIVMEWVEGDNVKDIIDSELSAEIGRYAASMHSRNIIHGDLTTSNFIFNKKDHKLTVIDFGLSYYSERFEDKAVDVRLIKEIFISAYANDYEGLYSSFLLGYRDISGDGHVTARILSTVQAIEKRGRYARMT